MRIGNRPCLYSYRRVSDKYNMNTNLDKIALDLYGKISTRFSDIKIGDENAEVLSKKSDIPKARFFEFDYVEHDDKLGSISVTLDEDDGVIVQVSGELADSHHTGAFKFIRSFRQFAKDRLLNFDVQNTGKDNLDKRDYQFKAKPKEQPMEPIMENKLFGTARMSYQDLGEAKIIIKHNQPVNTELAAGRTMHIESIYVENAQGERFRYPFKHLGGARALAEHLKHGGIPYDAIGKHITSLSEELANLRKFKNYVGRNEALSEAMGDITDRVFERIEQIKKQVHGLARKPYYEQFAESFTEAEDQMIPEDIMSDWIDRLTIRTFNEELKTAFPYIFKLVSETDIPVKELSADELLAERVSPEWLEVNRKAKELLANGMTVDQVAKQLGVQGPNNGMAGSMGGLWGAINKAAQEVQQSKPTFESPEDQFESFMDGIMNEDEDDTLFSPDKQVQQRAIDKLNDLLDTELQGGPDAVNAIGSLKGIIDDPEFLQSLDDIDAELDIRPLIQQYVQQRDPEVAIRLKFDGEDQIGGQDLPEPPAGAEAPPPEAAPAPAAPAAPQAPAPEAPPVAEGHDEDPPFDGPYTRNKGTVTDKSGAKHSGRSQARHLARQGLIKAIHTAKDHGAKLDTTLDFGHRTMTLHDCIEECGMSPTDFGFDTDNNASGTHEMLKSVAGFWNSEEKNFTIGGTRAKTKVVKDFKNGEFKNANEDDLAKVLKLIDKMDPSGNEHNQIMRLSGVSQTIDEDPTGDHFASIMQQFQKGNPNVNIDQLFSQWKQQNPGAKVSQSNTSSGNIDGKSSSYDDAVNKIKGMKFNIGGQDFDPSDSDAMQGQIKNTMGGMMKGMHDKMPNQNIQAPGVQMNPRDMMKDIMGKLNFGN